MTTPTQAQIEAAAWEIVRGGGHTVPPDEARIIAKAAITAAAEVGEPTIEQIEDRWERKFKDAVQNIENKAIERCAQVAEARIKNGYACDAVAAIRALKED